MKIILEPIDYDPRSYRVTIDFTGYANDPRWFPIHGRLLIRQDTRVPDSVLDGLLATVKLRRIKYWHYIRPARHWLRTNIYYTVVISDRWNKRNDVG